tara:strand:- start:392 stop:697 length:306 start_codon:yes stop_codon:yes gene_type:complete
MSLNSYTTEEVGKVTEVNPLSLMSVEPFTEEETNSGAAFSFPTAWYFHVEMPRVVFDKNHHNGFIGILTDEEADEMKAGIELFKKRFDDDLTRRNKILFGE